MFEEIVKRYSDKYKVVVIDFLGYGKSQRVDTLPDDIWIDEAKQVSMLIEKQGYTNVNLIGCGGGAIVAINVALLNPEKVKAVIADSFDGLTPDNERLKSICISRNNSKDLPYNKAFYENMHGDDWENVLDIDCCAITNFIESGKSCFVKPVSEYKPKLLLTGSKCDEIFCNTDKNYFKKVYIELIRNIKHGQMHIFSRGNNPCIISNPDRMAKLSKLFLG